VATVKRRAVKTIAIAGVAVPVAAVALARRDRALSVATGFVSDTLCAETFVSGLDPAQVYAETVKPVPAMRLLGWTLRRDVDVKGREVRTTLAGGFESRAVYREGRGCIPVHGAEPTAVAIPRDSAPGSLDTAVPGRGAVGAAGRHAFRRDTRATRGHRGLVPPGRRRDRRARLPLTLSAVVGARSRRAPPEQRILIACAPPRVVVTTAERPRLRAGHFRVPCFLYRRTAVTGFDLEKLGRQVRLERSQRGLSLNELAERAGVSRSMLSAVERGHKAPTVLVLDRIATGLGTSLARLLGDPRQGRVILLRHGDQDVARDPSGWERRILSPVLPGVEFEFMRTTIPGGVDAGVFAPHGGGSREYLAVERGRLRLTLDGVVHTLRTGDSIYYSGDCDHGFANPGDRDCVYYLAMDVTAASHGGPGRHARPVRRRTRS
jgi:transcriptional regulator with XRE-family HTH domain